MKPKYLFTPLLAGAVAFSSCKEKTADSSASNSSTPEETVENGGSSPNLPKSSATVSERAAKLGFAKHLPKDLASYQAIYNGRNAFEEFLKTPIGVFILERLMDEGIELDDVIENEEAALQLAAYGEEYFAAYGEGSKEAFNLAIQFLERLAFYGANTGIFAANAQLRDGEFDPESPAVLLNGPLKGSIKELVGMFGKFDMPAYYQGSKVSDSDMRTEYASFMEQGLGVFQMMGPDLADEITIKRGENEFAGYKLSGAKLVELMKGEDMSAIEEFIDTDDINAFMTSLAQKNIVAVSGVVGDYVLIFVGKSEDDFVLVEKPEDSVCANDKLADFDGYLDKNILAINFRDGEAMENVSSLSQLTYRVVSAAAEGMSAGLGEADSLGDTSDIEALLESLASQGKGLASLFKASDTTGVLYIEDGLKGESWGGSNYPYIDFAKTHTFASMGEGEGTLLFSNWTNSEEYNRKVMEYLDTLGETSYIMSKRIAALDIDDGDFRDFKQGIELFDKGFRSDALELWKALREDLAGGLGSESAIVVDINGSFPKVPNVPEVLLKEGKVPRIAYVSQVSDRAKLQKSWGRINTSIENMLKTIGEMQGGEIPMQVPMSSEKNDLKTWFIPIPFQNDDFVPSVSVSDKLFFASTSKTFSEGLTERFKQGGGESRKGAWLHVDFEILNTYAQQWFKLIEKNADEAIEDENMREDFMANRDKIQKALKALETLKKMTMHTRDEGGRVRTSLHLQAN